MRIVLSFLLLLIVVSCQKRKRVLSDGVWTFDRFQLNTDTSIFDIDSARHERIVIRFERNRIGVFSVVNECGANYRLNNGLTISELFCTEMASLDSLDNALENRFLNAIQNTSTYHIEDTSLTIQYEVESDSLNELVFTKNNCAC